MANVKPPMKFEIYRDKRLEFRSRIVASNGNILFDSGEGYKTKASCKRAYHSMLKHARGFQIRTVDTA